MIAAISFLLAFSGQEPALTPIFQFADPRLDTCSFAAAVPVPDLDARDAQLLRLAMELLPKGSDVYTPGILRKVTQGRPVRCHLGGDFATISFTVPKESETDGAELLVSLIKQPSFQDEAIMSAIPRLSRQSQDYWSRQVEPFAFDLKAVSRDELLNLFHRVFTPAAVRAEVIAPKAAPKVDEIWRAASSDWPPSQDIQKFDVPISPALPSAQDRVATGEIVGSSIAPSAADFYPKILSLYALGSGKRSALYRLAREKHAWSYRQEAFLECVRTGWEPHLFVAMAPQGASKEKIMALQTELIADVNGWTEDDLAAAKGMAEANLRRQVPFGPFLIAGQPLTSDPEQAVAIDLTWLMKTGRSWSAEDMFTRLNEVSLQDMKSAALSILTPSQVKFLPVSR